MPRRGALEERARAPLACWFQEIVGHGGMPIQRHESPTQGASPPSPFQLMLASTSIPLRACFESRWAAVLGSVHGRMHSGRTSESCSHQQRQAMGGPVCRPGCRSGASMRGLRPTLACSSHAHDTKRQLAREVLRHRASGPPLRPAERGKASLGPGLHGRALSLGGDVFVGRSHSQLARGLMGAGNPRFCTQSGSTTSTHAGNCVGAVQRVGVGPFWNAGGVQSFRRAVLMTLPQVSSGFRVLMRPEKRPDQPRSQERQCSNVCMLAKE